MSRKRRAVMIAAKDAELGNDDNMIPLINIVFLLLIFFMVAGHISRLSEGTLKLPKTVAERSADEESLVLQMDLNQQLFLNGDPVELIELDNILHSNVATAAVLDSHGLALQIDEAVTAENLDPVLNALRQMGIPKVQLHALLNMDAAL